MKTLANAYFILFLVIGVGVYTCQRQGVIFSSFIQNYLNDLVCIPIVLFIILSIVRLWKGSYYQLTNPMLVCVVLYFSFYFEYYLPQHHTRYTSDLLDVVCYGLGGGIFYVIQRYKL